MKKLAIFSIIILILFAYCKQNGKSSNKIQTKPVVKMPVVPLDTFSNNLSAFLSGMPVQKSRFDSMQKLPGWKSFSKYMDSIWNKIDSCRLQKMVKWTGSELQAPTKNSKIVFYPFAGPDFLHAFTFFPNADTFILMGLESVGNLPDISKMKTANLYYYFENLKISLSDIFNKSYFITRKMGDQLQQNKIDGVLPVICFFLKRTGNEIVSIEKVDINDKNEGVEVKYTIPSKTHYWPCGIKIRFVNSNYSTVKTVYYFSADLSDGAYNPNYKLYKYLDKKINKPVTYIKSASYLLHYTFFSNVRSQILSKSLYILQDDTGIPYKDFDPKIWNVQLYGVYVQPIKDFKGLTMQPDLIKAYHDTVKKVKPLPFNIGYHWSTKEDNLIYAEKK